MRLIGLAVILALSLFIVMRAQNHRFSAARLNLARKRVGCRAPSWTSSTGSATSAVEAIKSNRVR